MVAVTSGLRNCVKALDISLAKCYYLLAFGTRELSARLKRAALTMIETIESESIFVEREDKDSHP